MEIKLFTDGGIRDGLMALGFVAYDMDGNELFCGCRSCGKNGSSNISEYRAIIAGLMAALNNGVNIVHIYSDSQLVVRQVLQTYNVNKAELRKHRDHILKLLERFDGHTIEWIPRRNNKRADTLVSQVFERRNGKCSKKQQKQNRKDLRL